MASIKCILKENFKIESNYIFLVLLIAIKLFPLYVSIRKFLFLSHSIEINNHENDAKLHRPIHRHYASIKSNISRRINKIVSPSIENIPDETLLNHRKLKQFRNEFIQKWTDDTRNIYARNHLIHTTNTYSDQMTTVDLKEKNRSRRKSTYVHRHHSLSSSSSFNHNIHTSSSPLLNQLHNHKTEKQLSNSMSLSSIVDNRSNLKHKNMSSNNSTRTNPQSKNIPNDIECKIS